MQNISEFNDEYTSMKSIKNNLLENYLKDVVRNSFDLEKNPYDFKDEFIKNSGFDFCPVYTQFFLGKDDDDEEIANNLINYSIKNNYKKFYAINTEFIDKEEIIHDDKNYYKWYIAYEFKINIYDLFLLNDRFKFGISVLLTPEKLDFYMLLTDSYDILVGSRIFIEEIVKTDIITAINNFEEHTSCYRSDNINKLTKKYKDIIYSKYYKI